MIATDGAIELGIHPHPSLLTSSTCHSLHRLVFSFLSLFLLSFISFLHFFPSFLSVPQLSAPASFSFFSSGLSAPGPFERCLFPFPSPSPPYFHLSLSLSLLPFFLLFFLFFFLARPGRRLDVSGLFSDAPGSRNRPAASATYLPAANYE